MRTSSPQHNPFRIFAFSGVVTIAALTAVFVGLGVAAMLVALILIAVEIAFSFDNAILNARILSHMSRFWQNMFLTLGAIIAVFGMRIVFPILIVSLTARLGWHEVLNLALHHPVRYADALQRAHPIISAFGGAFLLMLALHFFVDSTRKVRWLDRPERHMQRVASGWGPPLISLVAIAFVTALPINHYGRQTITAGIAGIAAYSLIQLCTVYMGKIQRRQAKRLTEYTGVAALISFLYLEVLDASFSFDGVLGAFAVTKKVVLIAIGLGVGALWVRSLTIFMVRRGTLGNYRYIEHGAHYTIGILACLLLISIFYDVPEVITGLAGLGVIFASIMASRQAMHAS